MILLATIQTSIELQDKFTGTLDRIIGSVNSGLSAMEELHRAMSGSVDTVSFDAARRSVDRTAAAVQQLDRAVQRVELPEMTVPAPQQPEISEAPVYCQTEVPPPVVGQPEAVAGSLVWQTDTGELFANREVEAFEVPVIAPEQPVSVGVSLLRQTDTGELLANTEVEAFGVPVIAPKQPEPAEIPVLWQTDTGDLLANTEVEAFEVPVAASEQPEPAEIPVLWRTDTGDLLANTEVEAFEVPVVAPERSVSVGVSLLRRTDTGDLFANTEVKAFEVPVIAPKQPEPAEIPILWRTDTRDLLANTEVEALEVPVIAPKQPESAEIPVLWRTDTIDVFTNSDVDGFERRARGAMGLLNGLNQVRRQFAAETAQKDIFPVNYVSQFEIETALSDVELEAAADTSEAAHKINALRENAGSLTVPVFAETGVLAAAFDQIAEKAEEVRGRGVLDSADAVKMMNECPERLEVNIGVLGFESAKAKLGELCEQYRELTAPIPAFNGGGAVSDAFGKGWTVDAFEDRLRFDSFGNGLGFDTFENRLRFDTFEDGLRFDTFEDKQRFDAFEGKQRFDSFWDGCRFDAFECRWTVDVFGNGWRSDGFTADAFKLCAGRVGGDVGNVGFVPDGIFGEGDALTSVVCLPQDNYADKINKLDISGGEGDISDNTGGVPDSFGISEEDLRQLRDTAETETVNHFSTAEITIEQHNTNNISSEMDLDSVIEGLTEAAAEAVYIAVEGVHT